MRFDDYLRDNITNTTEFIECYDKLLEGYGSKKTLNVSENYNIDIQEACRIVDILTKTNDPILQNVALEMIVMLESLFETNTTIIKTKAAILSSTMNFPGLEAEKMKILDESVLDKIYKSYRQRELEVSSDSNEHFLPEQKKVIDYLSSANVLSFSGPTSMGKSYVIRQFIIKGIQSGRKDNYAYTIPTKALMNEISNTLMDDIEKCEKGKDNYAVITSPDDLALRRENCNFIFVMTPERLVNLLRRNISIFINYIFIDEAHILSKENEERGALYYQIVELLSCRVFIPKYVFSSPFIPNPEIYSSILEESIESQSYASNTSPVAQFRMRIDIGGESSIYNRFTDSFESCGKACDKTRLGVVYKIGKDSTNIVYCRSLKKAMLYANDFANEFCKTAYISLTSNKNQTKIQEELNNAADIIEKEIHESCFLANLIRKGVAYHIGFLPSRVRKLIENLFRERKLKYLFCTSTVIEGVNLPADNLFIFSLCNGQPKLTPIELNNLMGRAGRIRYSIYGNVYFVNGEGTDESCNISSARWRITNEELGLDKFLRTDSKGQKIVACLKNKDMEFEVIDKERRREAVRYSSLLINSLCTGNKSRVDAAFSPYLTKDDRNVIRDNYVDSAVSILDVCELGISESQMSKMREFLLLHPDFSYPDIRYINDEQGKEKVREFLRILRDAFIWDIYEHDSLGRGDSYKYYANVLYSWLKGFWTHEIIINAITYRKFHRDSPIYLRRDKLAEYYDPNDPYHVNYVIASTLDSLENVIQFKLSNYFQCFSNLYKETHLDSKGPVNDWSEYISFGTMDEDEIEIQKIGFSRNSAKLIVDNFEKYCLRDKGKIMIKSSLLACESDTVLEEAEFIRSNNPSRFVD